MRLSSFKYLVRQGWHSMVSNRLMTLASIGVLVACLFFGLCDALQIRLQVTNVGVPYQFFQMIPYIATVLVLAIVGSKKSGPKANGLPYRKEER